MKIKKQSITENYAIYNGDCNIIMPELPKNNIHFSIFSPPFPELYTYSDNIADLGNTKNFKEFNQNFEYTIKNLYPIMMPGRVVAIHCMDIPLLKSKHDVIGLYDWTGDIVELMTNNGFIYEGRTTIWKNPVVEQSRTKAKGLLMKNLLKDGAIVRTGHPDYLLKFIKEGENPEPVKHYQSEKKEWANYREYNQLTEEEKLNYVTLDWWQKAASPIWLDIEQGNTLNNFREGKSEKDVKHICPLQLDTIKRAIKLWTNPGDNVLSPFGGIGSEGYQALKMKRKSINIELKPEYFLINEKNHRNAVLNNQLTFF